MRGGLIVATIVAVVIGALGEASAICRRVVEIGSVPPIIDPEQSVIVIKRSDVPIGQDCAQPADGGVALADASVVLDASAALVDAGLIGDAAVGDAEYADAAHADARYTDAGYNDAGDGCEIRYGDAITMIVRPQFTIGVDGSSFALLMVTPAPPVVEVQDQGLFRQLAEVTATRVQYDEVYVEDSSLGYQCDDPKWNANDDFGGGCGGGGGGGSGGGGWQPPEPQDPTYPADAGALDDVTIQTIGAYDVAVLAVDEVAELGDWLDANSFGYTSTDLDAIEPYVAEGWTVIAARINTDEPLSGGGLEPLSFTYEGDEIRLPLGVSHQPGGGESFLSVYIAADGRYELPGASVPYAQQNGMGGASFLTRNNLFADLSNTAADDPIAERISGDPEFHETTTITREIHIPVSDCPPPPPSNNNSNDDEVALCGCGTNKPSPRRTRGTMLLIGLCALIIGRKAAERNLRRLSRRG